MNYEDKVHSNWTNAVFYFTDNFLSFEKDVVAGLKSQSSEVRCASIAILNQCNDANAKEHIFSLLDDESEQVTVFVLEYLMEFGESHHAKDILKYFDKYPFLTSSALDRLAPNTCGIINDDDSLEEKEMIKRCWQNQLT